MERNKMRRRGHVIIILSGKGGVGKTTVARSVGETLRDRRPDALIADGNGSIGQTLQFLGARGDDGKLLDPQPEVGGVRVFSMHGDERDRDQFAALAESAATLILADLPAESLSIVARLQEEIALFDLFAERGYEVTLAVPLTPYRASVRDVADALSLTTSVGASLVVVRNLAFGAAEDPSRGDPDGDWGIWLRSQTRARVIDAGALVIDLPALRSRIMAALDDRSMTFADAQTSSEIGIADRQRLAVWLRATRAAFEPLMATIAPNIAADKEITA
jgi:hypothetical protein